MKKLMLVMSLMLASSAGYANDEAMFQGEELHGEKCTGCHGTEVYTRPDHRVKNMNDLHTQVERCMKSAAKANWNTEQTSAVVEYLNTRFYKF